jgi:hypothetical protein
VEADELAPRLVDCEQRLASLPELERRLDRALAENDALRAELESTRTALHEVTASPSWRVTEPLRKLRRLGRRAG